MYERFYGFRERPFSLTPDPSYLYPSRVHKEALSHLRYGIEGHAGFTVITGEIGCGKTTLLQTVLRSIDRKTSISRLMNTMLDSRELLEAIMLDFGLDPGHGRSKPYLIRDLAQFLVNERRAGRLALLIIDEAQNLSISALEEVRMLSNFETEKSKLIQIVLVGQPNLRDLLARHDLEQLRQRVTVSYHIEPLTPEDTHAYINHRLRHASVGAPVTFSRAVTDVIHKHSRGVARTINVISDAVLLYGYGSDKRIIDIELVHEVVADLGLNETQGTAQGDAAQPLALAQPAMATAPPVAPATAVDVTDVMQLPSPLIEAEEIEAAETMTPMEIHPHAVTAAIRAFPEEASLRRPHADLPLQAPPAAAPAPPMPVSRVSPGSRMLSEVPSGRQPHKSWWSRLRRGVTGQPRSTVEV
jgi:general secretion pathway protein A